LDLTGRCNFLEEKLHRKIDIVTPAALRKELRTQILGELVAV
jgi:predicted nucleotidyltransferase